MQFKPSKEELINSACRLALRDSAFRQTKLKQMKTIITRKLSAIPGLTKAQARKDKQGESNGRVKVAGYYNFDNSEGLARMSWAKLKKRKRAQQRI
jgi:hypothetical protein